MNVTNQRVATEWFPSINRFTSHHFSAVVLGRNTPQQKPSTPMEFIPLAALEYMWPSQIYLSLKCGWHSDNNPNYARIEDALATDYAPLYVCPVQNFRVQHRTQKLFLARHLQLSLFLLSEGEPHTKQKMCRDGLQRLEHARGNAERECFCQGKR